MRVSPLGSRPWTKGTLNQEEGFHPIYPWVSKGQVSSFFPTGTLGFVFTNELTDIGRQRQGDGARLSERIAAESSRSRGSRRVGWKIRRAAKEGE